MIIRSLKLIPTSVSSLFETLVQRYPHPSFEVEYHRNFAFSLVSIMEACPILRDRIISLIVERMLMIDVKLSNPSLSPR